MDSWMLPFAAMKELRASWPSRGWSWDARLSCVSSSFDVDLSTRARTAAAIVLKSEWTPATIHRAPPPLRELAESAGGLRAGQVLLSSATIGTAFAYGLWWPWGDGMTTSLRIGLGGSDATPDALQRMRTLFAVEV